MSYRVVQIIPLEEMSGEDWKLLDYTFLRNTAKNRIASMLNEDFFGFAKVNIFQKARAKLNYLWPVSVVEAEEVSLTKELTVFGFVADEDLTEEADALDDGVGGISSAIAFYGIYKVVQVASREEEKLEPLFTEEFYSLNPENQAEAMAFSVTKFRGLPGLEKFVKNVEDELDALDDYGVEF